MSIVKTVLLLTAILGNSQGAAMAADYKLNPFTLAYDGAITENVRGKVNILPVIQEPCVVQTICSTHSGCVAICRANS